MTLPDWPDLLAEAGYTGTAALVVEDLSGARLYAHAADRVFPAASTIKVPLLIRALQRVQAGELDLDARTVMRAEDRVGGSGVLHELAPGLAPSLLDLLTLMIVVSDNTATNLVIGAVGEGDLNGWLAEHGLANTHLIGRLQLPEHLRSAAQRRGERNRTSARDQARLLGGLARGEWLGPALTGLALDILGRQQFLDLLGRHLPRDPDGELIYKVASKSGELRGVHHDVGIVWTPRPLVVALLSEGGQDPREHPENAEVRRLAGALWPVLGALGDILPAQRAVD